MAMAWMLCIKVMLNGGRGEAMVDGFAARLALECDTLLFGVPTATGPIIWCRGFSSGAGGGKGVSMRHNSWDDARILFPTAFGVLAAVAAWLPSCLASCFIICLSILFACLVLVHGHYRRHGHQGPISKQQ